MKQRQTRSTGLKVVATHSSEFISKDGGAGLKSLQMTGKWEDAMIMSLHACDGLNYNTECNITNHSGRLEALI